MPCWEVNTVTVEFKASNRRMLEDAINSLGWKAEFSGSQVTLITPNGPIRLDLSDQQHTIDQSDLDNIWKLKREYSKKTIYAAARKYGWSVQKASSANTFAVQRR